MTAWTGRRRRRDLLRLEADDDVALTGATAAAAVRWWTAQVLSRSGPAVGQCRGGVTLTWEAGNATARARLRPSTAEAPAPGASRMVRAPQDEPRVSDTWWRAVLALAAMSGAIDTAGAVSSQGGGVKEQGLPPMVRLEEASGDIVTVGAPAEQADSPIAARSRARARCAAVRLLGAPGVLIGEVD